MKGRNAFAFAAVALSAIALLIVLLDGCKPITDASDIAHDAKPLVEGGCKVVEAFTPDSTIESLCATASELLELADLVRSARPDAGRKSGPCKAIPETTTCATDAELVPAIRAVKAKRPKDGGLIGMKIKHLKENVIPGRRLGRHVEHDPKSRSFAISSVSGPLVSRNWYRNCPPFQQGELGSCTGNAMIGACMTDPIYIPGRSLGEGEAVGLYSEATKLDNIAGHYPPEDTGSSGVAVAKAAHRRGLIAAYKHAFSLHAALIALTHGPIIVGTNWYEGFDQPSAHNHELTISGDVRGGHEYEILAIDVDRRVVRMVNSWGSEWGDHGYAVMSFATLEQLLDEDGDAVVPIGAL